MKPRDLLPEAAPDSRIDGIEVAGVTSDSRKVKPGFLFVAIAGNKTDGAHFVKQAASDGAVAVVAEQRPDTLPDAMAFIRAANPRRLLALAAAKIFPRQPATIAAVTGTRPAYRSQAEIEDMYSFAERIIYPVRADHVMHDEAAQ